MKIGVVVGHRYNKVGTEYYTYTSYHADMWKEHLEVFDEVILLDRVVYSDQVASSHKSVLTENVQFIEYPSGKGMWGIIKTAFKMFFIARKAVKKADVWNLHAPDIGTLYLWLWATIYKVPYMLEYRGDQSMTPVYLKIRGFRFPSLIAKVIRMMLWFQRANPIAVVGVSHSLVDQFPPRNGCDTFVISDNRIPESWYTKPRQWTSDNSARTIVCVGRVEAQKNPLGTMRALSKLNEKGFRNWNFIWLGSGPMLEQTQALAQQLGISEQVDLKGFVKWDDIFEILDQCDLFLLNTVSEGLPRALVEGMARALPAVAADVGGVPELLSPEDIIPLTDDEALAGKLFEVLQNSQRLTKMSERNLEVSKQYSSEFLSSKKREFYEKLKKKIQSA